MEIMYCICHYIFRIHCFLCRKKNGKRSKNITVYINDLTLRLLEIDCIVTDLPCTSVIQLWAYTYLARKAIKTKYVNLNVLQLPDREMHIAMQLQQITFLNK